MDCPDRQMLSVYLDGELPSPWRERVGAHVAGCPDCAARIAAYRLASGARPDGDPPACGESVVGARDRVWRRLGASSGGRGRRSIRLAILRPRVSISVPAAMAVLIAALSFALVRGSPDDAPSAGISIVSESEMDVPVVDMESVMESLAARGGDALIIRLPESHSFVSSGEPAMIRAADYSRQMASWNARVRGED